MSRSYRKPYSTSVRVRSSKEDKQLASHGVRRAQDLALRNVQDYDSLLLPHKLECTANEVYDWNRDGKKRLDHKLRFPGRYSADGIIQTMEHWYLFYPEQRVRHVAHHARYWPRLFRK